MASTRQQQTDTRRPTRRAAAQGGSAQPRRRARRPLTNAQRARGSKIAQMRGIGVLASAGVLAAVALVGLLFFARPATSEVERRNLAQFPELSWSSFWDGSFFSDVALWYSDTYPLREQMVAANQTMEGLHGIKPQTQMVGGNIVADELPVVQQTPGTTTTTGQLGGDPAPEADEASAAQGEGGEQDAESPEAAEQSAEASTEQAVEPASQEREQVEVPTQEVMAAAIQDQITNGLYVKGDAAYNIYYFVRDAVDEYVRAVNTAADELDGHAQVYCMVAPNASGIMLSDQEVQNLGGTNQVEAIKYFYSIMSPKVRVVDTVPELKAHTDEYIYYRTDHHWTARGAYWAYVAFCKAKGTTPKAMNSFKQIDLGNFLGSLYSELGSQEMKANPDRVEAWIPSGTNEMTLYDEYGNAEIYNVITDTSEWAITGKTMAFIMGDQPLEKIENPAVTDGSSCLVFKDSFGDFFVPWLVDDYSTVWVADFRYFNGNLKDFIIENDVDDFIIESNISLAGGGAWGDAILGRL